MQSEIANHLQKHFDIALEVPDGIKKLRELILTLAIQGKLVEQDSNDQPAKQILEIVDTAKSQQVKISLFKATQAPAPLAVVSEPFLIPNSWLWLNLERLCAVITQGPNPKYSGGGDSSYRVLKTKDFYDNRILYSQMEHLSKKLFEEHKRYELKDNDIIFGLVGKGSTAKCNIYQEQQDFRCIFTRATGLIRLADPEHVLPRYVHAYFLSSHGKRTADSITDGSTGQLVIRTSELKKVAFPLPPLAEQKRIVAKIDQLMALCDKLEAERNARDQKRVSIHTAAVSQLLSAPDKPAFDKSWQFITQHFSELYSVAPNVTELKKAILQLAVMGKLVPQDPNDQPASALLKQIEADPSTSLRTGKARRAELPPIKADEIPYQLPQGWEWVRLGEMIELISGQHLTPNEYNVRKQGFSYYTGPADFGKDNPIASRWTTVDRAIAISGDILITVKGAGVGKTNVLIEEKAAISRQLMAIRGIKINREYLLVFLKKIFLELQGLSVGIAIPGISREDVQYRLLPLPPLAEQQRIVAKVDQLLALCDALSTHLAAAGQKREQILGAVLAGVH